MYEKYAAQNAGQSPQVTFGGVGQSIADIQKQYACTQIKRDGLIELLGAAHESMSNLEKSLTVLEERLSFVTLPSSPANPGDAGTAMPMESRSVETVRSLMMRADSVRRAIDDLASRVQL